MVMTGLASDEKESGSQIPLPQQVSPGSSYHWIMSCQGWEENLSPSGKPLKAKPRPREDVLAADPTDKPRRPHC